jgi:hypothetical protein
MHRTPPEVVLVFNPPMTVIPACFWLVPAKAEAGIHLSMLWIPDEGIRE